MSGLPGIEYTYELLALGDENGITIQPVRGCGTIMFSFEDYTFLVYLMQLQQNAINGLTEPVSSAPQQWHELEQLVYISE